MYVIFQLWFPAGSKLYWQIDLSEIPPLLKEVASNYDGLSVTCLCSLSDSSHCNLSHSPTCLALICFPRTRLLTPLKRTRPTHLTITCVTLTLFARSRLPLWPVLPALIFLRIVTSITNINQVWDAESFPVSVFKAQRSWAAQSNKQKFKLHAFKYLFPWFV